LDAQHSPLVSWRAINAIDDRVPRDVLHAARLDIEGRECIVAAIASCLAKNNHACFFILSRERSATTMTRDAVRIGNASGFYGDRFSAFREMLEGGPLDLITGDYLAELTLLILGRDRIKDPSRGYARTFLRQIDGAKSFDGFPRAEVLDLVKRKKD
jgi:hypothetical protein